MSDRQMRYYTKTLELFYEADCVPLEPTYRPAKSKWRFFCKCGHIGSILPDDFKRGRRCANCTHLRRSVSRRTDIKDVHSYFKGLPETLLNASFEEGRTFCEYLCRRDHRVKREFFKFKQGTRCLECARIEAANRYRLPWAEVVKAFEDNGCELLGGQEYVNVEKRLRYLCSCGNISESYVSAMRRGFRCGCQRLRGSDNPNWNEEKTHEERILGRSYPEYRKWVRDVYERDDYTCQKCGERGGRLNAHHILGYAKHAAFRTDLDNGATLCGGCHTFFHSTYGINRFTGTDYFDFVNEVTTKEDDTHA